MITVQIDDSTMEGLELTAEIHKRPASAHRVYHYRNGRPEGYLTAEDKNMSKVLL